MADESKRTATPSGCLVRALVCVAVVAGLVAVGTIAFAVWVTWSLDSYRERMEQADLANMRRRAVEIGQRLYVGSRDGTLTDAEIDSAALRYPWHAERTSTWIRITVRIQASTPVGARCFGYALGPLQDSGAPPAPSETLTCPAATYHRAKEPAVPSRGPTG